MRKWWNIWEKRIEPIILELMTVQEREKENMHSFSTYCMLPTLQVLQYVILTTTLEGGYKSLVLTEKQKTKQKQKKQKGKVSCPRSDNLSLPANLKFKPHWAISRASPDLPRGLEGNGDSISTTWVMLQQQNTHPTVAQLWHNGNYFFESGQLSRMAATAPCLCVMAQDSWDSSRSPGMHGSPIPFSSLHSWFWLPFRALPQDTAAASPWTH